MKLIHIVVIGIVSTLIFLGGVTFLTVKACTQVEKAGLKSVIEEVWEGKNTHGTLPDAK